MGPAEVTSTWPNVWSLGELSVKTTVLSSLASTDFMLPSSDAGPLGSLILTMRLKENATSDAVRALPLANFRPSLIVQTYSVGCAKSHFDAASGVSVVLPAGKLRRYW